ncbi:MAG: hypothetical protein ABIR57_00245 [Aeromicrobium sp.]
MASLRPGNTQLNDPSWSGSRKTIRLLSLVTAIGIFVGIVGLLLPRVFSYDNSSTAGDSKQVVARVTDFAATYNTYDVAKVADYQKRVKGLVSPSYNKEFVQVTNAIFKALKDKKQVSKNAKVLDVAVDSIDKDSAVALVAVDASVSNSDAKASISRHLRWKVNMVKLKGSWYVDKFESVAALTAEPSTPTATPTEGDTSK